MEEKGRSEAVEAGERREPECAAGEVEGPGGGGAHISNASTVWFGKRRKEKKSKHSIW